MFFSSTSWVSDNCRWETRSFRINKALIKSAWPWMQGLKMMFKCFASVSLYDVFKPMDFWFTNCSSVLSITRTLQFFRNDKMPNLIAEENISLELIQQLSIKNLSDKKIVCVMIFIIFSVCSFMPQRNLASSFAYWCYVDFLKSLTL